MSSEGDVLTGALLTDLEILAYADDTTFRSLCSTNKRLNQICTNPRYQNQLYERKIQINYPEYWDLVREANIPKKEIYKGLQQLDKSELLELLTTEKLYPESLIIDRYLSAIKLLIRVNPQILTDAIGKYGYGYKEDTVNITREFWPFMSKERKEALFLGAVHSNYLEEVKWMLAGEDKFHQKNDALSSGNYRMFKLLQNHGLHLDRTEFFQMTQNKLIQMALMKAASLGETAELEEFKKDGLIPTNLSITRIEPFLSSKKFIRLFEWFRENRVKVKIWVIDNILRFGRDLSEEAVELLKAWPADLVFT